MATKKTEREQYEMDNAPYLIEGARLVRNYELLPTTHPVDNNFVLDYIDCGSAEEAKHLRRFLWNAFAGGRNFQKADPATREAVEKLKRAALLVESLATNRSVTLRGVSGLLLEALRLLQEVK